MKTIYIGLDMLGDAEETTDIKEFCAQLTKATGYTVLLHGNASKINASNGVVIDDLIPQSVWNHALDLAAY